MFISRPSHKRAIIIALLCLLVITVVASLLVGPIKLPLSDLFTILVRPDDQPQALVVWEIRLPRTLMVVLVGSALAVAGAMIQGLFRNPLADPALIGVSQGAALSTVLITLVGVEWIPFLLGSMKALTLPLAAFLGGLLTTFVVLRIGRVAQGANTAAMLLAGVAINALAGAVIGLCQYLATEQQLKNMTFWMLGSFSHVGWHNLYFAAPIILLSFAFVPALIKPLNVLLLGESEAKHLGVNLAFTQTAIVILATLMVAAGVASVGVVGFVGLVVPHIIRLSMGPDHRYLIPASMLLGAAILLLADMAARTIVLPAELPIGILTALVGGPFFIYLIIKQKQKMSLL